MKEAQNAEAIMTEVLALEEGGKKIESRRNETEGMRLKFQSYLDESVKSKNLFICLDFLSECVLRGVEISNYVGVEGKDRVGEATTQSIETLRRAVMKRVLSYAKMNRKCYHCGVICKKMMLYESRIVYTLLGEYEGKGKIGNLEIEIDESEEGRKKTPNQKYLTPLEAR